MIVELITAGGVIAVLLVWGAGAAKRRQLADPFHIRWREIAAELGLACESSTIHGELDGRRVRIERVRSGDVLTMKCVDITVRGCGVRFALHSKNAHVTVAVDPIVLGDRELDARYWIEGDESAILVSLSEPMRVELVSSNVTSLSEGVLTAQVSTSDPAEICSAARRLVALAAALEVDRDDYATRLFTNLQVESSPRLQKRQLEMLLRTEPPPEVVDMALRHPDPKVRLLAATSNEPNLEVLRALALDSAVPDAVRASALLAVPRRTIATRELIELYPDAGPKTRTAITARFRDEAPDAEVEEMLLRTLGGEDEDLAIAATRSLGGVGTIAAVEPLRACSKAVMRSIVLRMAADDAIKEIQSRADGERGTLSLSSTDDRGALSISADSGGALSLKKES